MSVALRTSFAFSGDMQAPSTKEIQKAILTILDRWGAQSAYKYNLIGNQYQPGAIETHLGISFSEAQRVMAAAAFEQLKASDYVRPNFNSLNVDRENWVSLTEAGRRFLKAGLHDAIDKALAEIGEHLVAMRQGMHDAADRTSPDAPRHAANAAKELLDQVLKEGTSAACKTRKARIKHFLAVAPSKSDEEFVEACCKLIEAGHDKAKSKAHSRTQVTSQEARFIVDSAERALQLLFPRTNS